MTKINPKPLNLKLARFTPAWAKPQRARRSLVIVMYALLFATGFVSRLDDLLLFKLLELAGGIGVAICFAWLIGATGARADMTDEFLDERERKQRDQIYRPAFIYLMGFIAISFISSRLFSGEAFIGLLFFAGILLPTAVLAWVEANPLEV
jgi:hypothetical protein